MGILEFTLPPETARAANRHLQKLRLSGADVATLRMPLAACRSWVSAIDGRGDRLLWLVAPQVDSAQGYTALGMLINDVSGVLDAVGAGGVQEESLPVISQVGTLLPSLDLNIGGMISADSALGEHEGGFLVVPFTYGLKLLRDAVAANWATGTPLPIEYQLLNAAVWEFAIGQRAVGRKTALVTVNMDVFSRIVVPAHGLDRIFDVIVSSSDHRDLRKEILWGLAFAQLGDNLHYGNSLLIDDSPQATALFESRGGTAHRYENDQRFREWIHQTTKAVT